MRYFFILIILCFFSCKSEISPVAQLAFESKPEVVKEDVSPVIKGHTIAGFLSTDLYKGYLNETIEISLYLQEQEHPCGGNMTIIDAMYKYSNQKNWLLLSVNTNQQKKNYCLVENNFTGVLFLEEAENTLIGNWISPDTKKQYKVSLKKVVTKKTEIEKISETYDKLYYEINGGC